MALNKLFKLDIQEINNQVFAFAGLTNDEYFRLSNSINEETKAYWKFVNSLGRFIEKHLVVIHRVIQRNYDVYLSSTRYWKFKSIGCKKETLINSPRNVVEMYIIEGANGLNEAILDKFTYKKGTHYYMVTGKELDFLDCGISTFIPDDNDYFDSRMKIYRYFAEVFESNKNTIRENMKEGLGTTFEMEHTFYSPEYLRLFDEEANIYDNPNNVGTVLSHKKRKLMPGSIDNKMVLPGATNHMIWTENCFHTYEITFKDL